MAKQHLIMLGANSDIARAYLAQYHKSYSSFSLQSRRPICSELNSICKNANLLTSDISLFNSKQFHTWASNTTSWEVLISCIGSQEPIGRFDEVDPELWIEGILVNSLYQLAAINKLLPYRASNVTPTILLFAGGGTNSATPYYSAQTLGKILLIKAAELIHEELSDIRILALGPGWVKTKIHNSTLESPHLSRENYLKTSTMLASTSLCNPVSRVVDHMHTLISMPRTLVGGRNFSSVHDELTLNNLQDLHLIDSDFYRLRRLLNEFDPKEPKTDITTSH